MRRLAIAWLAALAAGCSSSSNAPPPARQCEGFPMPNPASTGLPRPASYTANADGTITDQVTKLTWEGSVETKTYMQDEAVAHCAAKGGGWRLPTRLELVSLVDYSIAAPGPTIDPIFKGTPGTTFWSASTYYGDDGDKWYVGFDAGYSDYGIVNQSSLVRCVLPSTPTCRVFRYQTEPGNIVYDQATGLIWQQPIDAGSYSWGDALNACAKLGAGWRVPSLTEAQTIVDDGHESPAVDPAAFPGTPSESFWTSSPKADGSGAAWYIDYFYGASDSDVADRLFRVRCVK
jgi:hypothetical protein